MWSPNFRVRRALADESGYLNNLYSIGVPNAGSDVNEIYVELGMLACKAKAAGYSKSEQEQLVAEASEASLEFGNGLPRNKFANKIALSARLFLCGGFQ